MSAQKAGIGTWEDANYTMLDWVERSGGLDWYYDWRPDQLWTSQTARRSVEFVPMIHNARDVDTPIRSDLRVRALLGFNEPDGDGRHQANMTVEEAVRLWPKLEARGLRLGSPATTQDNTLGAGSWLRRFMTETERRGLRVDFIAVHYYSETGDPEEFRNWLRAVYREYRKPIWVTEFALVDWSAPDRFDHIDNARFIERAVPMLDAMSFVERYAWFAALPYPWPAGSPEVNLVDDRLQPTPAGTAYRRAVKARALAVAGEAGS